MKVKRHEVVPSNSGRLKPERLNAQSLSVQVQKNEERMAIIKDLDELGVFERFDEKMFREALAAPVLEAGGKFAKMGIRMSVVFEWKNALEMRLEPVK